MEKNVSSNKSKIIIIILSTVLSVVSIALLGIIFYLFSNPKIVLLQSITRFTNSTNETIKKLNCNNLQNILKEDKVKVSSNTIISINEEELFNYNLSYLENKKDKKSAFDFNLIQNNKSLLAINGLLANNNIYIKIQDVMDYYYTEYPYISLFNDISTDDYQKIINIMSKSLKKELSDDAIIKTKENIKLGSKNKKVTKLSYKVTTKMISSIITNTIDEILKDENLVKSLSKTFRIEEKELKKNFQDFKTNLKSLKEDYAYYNVYYYGFNNIVLYELVYSKDTVKVYAHNNQYEIILMNNGKELFTLKMVENKDKYNISGNIGDYTYNGTLTLDENNYFLDLDTTIQGMIINLKMIETIKEQNNYQINNKISVNILGTVVEANTNTIYEIGTDIDLQEIENAKDVNTITDADIQIILANIENHPFLSSIYEFIKNYNDILHNTNLDLPYDNEEYFES